MGIRVLGRNRDFERQVVLKEVTSFLLTLAGGLRSIGSMRAVQTLVCMRGRWTWTYCGWLWRNALLSFVVLLLVIPGTHAAVIHSAVKPVPRADPWWKERAKLLDDRLEQTPDAEVLFIGDSIVQGWETAGKDVWARYYGSHKAVNLGIGGDRTQHVIWRLENAPLGKVKPKVAVVMIGTNNTSADDNTPGQIAEGVAAIVNKLRLRLPSTKVLLLAIFPRNENFGTQRGKIAQINQVLGKLADDPMVTFLDIGHRFLTLDGVITADIMPDYLHPSAEGYQLWAEAMEPTLKNMLGPAKEVAKLDPSGIWSWRMRGPDDQMVDANLALSMQNDEITGTFTVTGERDLAIESGLLNGKELALIVRRPRLQGGEVVYRLNGTMAGDLIQGKVSIDYDGEMRMQDWNARKRF